MSFTPTLAQAAERPVRPHFVVIIADDVSAEDLGCYGNRGIRTPNLDRMAERSLRFTHAYLTASSCSPSRSSIMASRYPHNLETASELHGEMPDNVVLFPQLLRENGYYTAQAGKTHFGSANNRLTGPGLRAFDVGEDGKPHDNHGVAVWLKRLAERPKNKPFFMWFASHDAHRPLDPGSFRGLNRSEDVVVPPYLVDTPETRVELALYYDEIIRFDVHVGEVMEELARQKVLENTVVIVMADNGRPFPHSKTQLYDDGIKTPLIVSWPATITRGAVVTSLVSSIDLAPTILELAGVKSPASFQGVSLTPILRDPKATVRDYVFAERNWHNFTSHVRMVRHGDWVYMRNVWPHLRLPGASDTFYNPAATALKERHARGQLEPLQANVFAQPRPAEELYNLRLDTHQARNLAVETSPPAQLARLRAVLDRWSRETGDTVPTRPTATNVDYETGKRGEVARGEPPGAAASALQINAPGPIRAK